MFKVISSRYLQRVMNSDAVGRISDSDLSSNEFKELLTDSILDNLLSFITVMTC